MAWKNVTDKYRAARRENREAGKGDDLRPVDPAKYAAGHDAATIECPGCGRRVFRRASGRVKCIHCGKEFEHERSAGQEGP